MSTSVAPAGARPPTVRVMILADVRLYREGLSRLIGGDESLILVGAAAVDGNAAASVVAANPDVVLIEAAAACETALIRDLNRLSPAIRVIAYGVQDEERQAVRCAEMGVAGFVMGDATGDELIGTIRSLAQGEFRCPPRVAAMLLRRISVLAQAPRADGAGARLTRREQDIIALIDRGLSNKEIARELGIELSTVKNHVHSILEKTKAMRRTQAAANFRRARLFDNPEMP